jgi:hypothetical protein
MTLAADVKFGAKARQATPVPQSCKGVRKVRVALVQ